MAADPSSAVQKQDKVKAKSMATFCPHCGTALTMVIVGEYENAMRIMKCQNVTIVHPPRVWWPLPEYVALTYTDEPETE